MFVTAHTKACPYPKPTRHLRHVIDNLFLLIRLQFRTSDHRPAVQSSCVICSAVLQQWFGRPQLSSWTSLIFCLATASTRAMGPQNCPIFMYRVFSNLIRTSFCRFHKRKKNLVCGSNPHLSFNRPLRAAPSEVARWVSAAWKSIPESIIVRSFKKCCISNALDSSENDIL